MATTKTSTDKSRKMQILLDAGSSNTILSEKYLGKVTSIKKSKSEHAIVGCLHIISKQGNLTFKLPEFSNVKDMTWSIDMDNGNLRNLAMA